MANPTAPVPSARLRPFRIRCLGPKDGCQACIILPFEIIAQGIAAIAASAQGAGWSAAVGTFRGAGPDDSPSAHGECIDLFCGTCTEFLLAKNPKLKR